MSGRSSEERKDNYQHHGERVVQRYLQEEILEDDELEATVEDLYSDGKIWEAVDLILEGVEQQREERVN
ncbi:hypothetical protein ACFQDG_07575 [Natronoarchaeum mannanilyticum]|uniref:Uncharacterized protein n=1 Tax=Natronoarchaeum mannanilyticum TaxID=926360 RepID=A0AAV3TAR8_9EURY